MSTPEKVKGKGQAARSAAVKRLLEAHEEEFEKILAEERESRGLFPRAKKPKLQDLLKEIEQLRAQIASEKERTPFSD